LAGRERDPDADGGHVHVGYSDGHDAPQAHRQHHGQHDLRVANALGSKGKVDVHDLDHDGIPRGVHRPEHGASDLGILGADTTDAVNDRPTAIRRAVSSAAWTRRSRLFIRNAHAAASLSISTPQLDAGGMSPTTDHAGITYDGLDASRASALSASMRRAADTSRAPSAWA